MPPVGLSIRRILPAPARRVFEAWTRPELMARWFFPDDGWSVDVKARVEVGGRYELSMRDPEGNLHRQFGEYREIVPVSRIVFTWCCPDFAVVDSVVTVDLFDQGHETELVLTHELLDNPDIRRSHEQGWTGCLNQLNNMLEKERD